MGHTNPWSLRRHQKKIPLTYHAQYIKSAGEALWAANELQNEYKRFFGALVSQSNAMGEAIWDTLVSDQAQRDILRAIIPITLTIGIQKRVAKNLLWALSETKSLAGYRNIAAHMPVSQSFFKGENNSIPALLARETAAHLVNVIGYKKLFSALSDELYVLSAYVSAHYTVMFQTSPGELPRRPRLRLHRQCQAVLRLRDQSKGPAHKKPQRSSRRK